VKNFNGFVLFLDRSDINTDEIIPAKYLTEITREALKPHLLEDLSLEEFIPVKDIEKKGVILTRENFGCRSSREHAPWALEVNGINMVIAVSFARIFRRNMFNNGMMAVEIQPETIDRLFNLFLSEDTFVETDMEKKVFIFSAKGKEEKVFFTIPDFDMELVKAGGWVDYADNKY